MLYDPKWAFTLRRELERPLPIPAPTSNPHPVYSLRGLLWWLETQDPRTYYQFQDPKDCLLTRYAAARGLSLLQFYGGSGSGGDAKAVRKVPSGMWAVARRGCTYSEAHCWCLWMIRNGHD